MSFLTPSFFEAPLRGRVVLVTGGASGIGLACAEYCGRAGAKVAVLSLGGPQLQQAQGALEGAGVEVMTFEADVRDVEQVEHVVERVTDRFGSIDAAILAAGIAEQSSVVSGDLARWRAVIETNLIGSASCLRILAPPMAAAGRGDIVLIASDSGREAYVGEPAYIASKWGEVGFGHAARLELERRGVRVSLIEPAIVDTPLTRGSPVVAKLLESGPSLSPHDVAASVLWVLCQPPMVSISELAVRAVGTHHVESLIPPE